MCASSSIDAVDEPWDTTGTAIRHQRRDIGRVHDDAGHVCILRFEKGSNMATTKQGTIRLLVADDDSDMRLLVRTALAIDGRFRVVAEAEDGLLALDAFRADQPDACILDYRMPGLTGFEVGRQILSERPETGVLLFAAYVPAEVLGEAAALGIRHLRKDLFQDLADILLDMA